MSKVAVASLLSERLGLTRAQGIEAVDAMLEGITRVLVTQQRITFVGFGSFQLRERVRRRTLESDTPQRITEVGFTPGENLRNTVQAAYPPVDVEPDA